MRGVELLQLLGLELLGVRRHGAVGGRGGELAGSRSRHELAGRRRRRRLDDDEVAVVVAGLVDLVRDDRLQHGRDRAALVVQEAHVDVHVEQHLDAGQQEARAAHGGDELVDGVHALHAVAAQVEIESKV